jgi:hypothetical protein
MTGKAVADGDFGFAKKCGDILLDVKAVADEERNYHQIRDLRQRVNLLDLRSFLHEHRVHLGIAAQGTDLPGLPLNGQPGILVAWSAVSGDEKGRVIWTRRAGGGMADEGLLSPGEKCPGHAGVSADRLAVTDCAILKGLNTAEWRLRVLWQTEGAGDYLGGEVAFTDHERDHEDFGSVDLTPNIAQKWSLLPECFVDAGEQAAATQLSRVLVDGSGGMKVLGRPVTGENEFRLREPLAVVHDHF